jgi:two-component system, sensor histidine kinase and response regulator
MSIAATIVHRESADSAPHPNTVARPPLSILLVEDTRAGRKITALMLKNRGHRVTVTRTGCQAVKRFASGRFDAILMDIEMPVMNGYQTAVAIRRKEQKSFARTPIIALSAHVPRSERQNAAEGCIDAYLGKPLDVDQLVSLIDSMRPEPDKTAKADDRAAGVALGGNCAGPVVDFPATMRRLDNDRALFLDFVEIFNEDAPRLLESIRSAAAAGDLTQISRSAHALRGLAANFDALALIQIASRLEFGTTDSLLQGQTELPAKLADEIARVQEALSRYVGR